MNETSPAGHTSQLAAVAHWARETPDASAIRFLADGDTVSASLTYAELQGQIIDRAVALLNHARPGERVGLCIASEFDYLLHALACFRAGLIAVPTLAPSNDRAIRRIEAHLSDAQAALVLVDDTAQARLALRPPEGPLMQIPRLDVAQLLTAPPSTPLGVLADLPPGDALAYLQYTSGSTMAPRGVVITHANLNAQEAMLHAVLKTAPGEALVNWMPLHHDFGLVMSLQALYGGACCVLIPPLRVVQQPVRWLRAMSTYKARTSASATSMLAVCTQKVKPEQCQGLDLASLQQLMVGAEPIQAGIIDAFCQRFAAFGLRADAILPAYGMAEATLCLSIRHGGAPVRKHFNSAEFDRGWAVEDTTGRELVSSGEACFPDSLLVVDPVHAGLCEPGQVGELWARSPSVGRGYWNNPSFSEAHFNGCLPPPGPQGCLRTGDLAFVHEGAVYITGRSKDLIIINGANHYPQDIEWTVSQCHPDLEAGACAAIGVDRDGAERLVVVTEVRRTARSNIEVEQVARDIRAAVVQQHEIDVDVVLLLQPAGLPRTSSGKVQRQACKQMFGQGSLPVLGQWQAQARSVPAQTTAAQVPELGAEVLGLCRDVLETPAVQAGDSVFAHGADSLKMAELVAEVEARWRCSIDLTRFHADPTPRELVRQVQGRAALAPSPVPTPAPLAAAPVAGGSLVAVLAAELQHRLASYTAAWQADWVSPNRLVFGLNTAGSKPPLFWCFQGHREFSQMATHLGPDQPVYGMRSGHLVFEHTDRSAVTGLAWLYLEEIARFVPQPVYFFGGNCQAGIVATRMARLMLGAGHSVRALFLLENIVPRVDPLPLPCPVSLFYGARSTNFNPLLQFHSPESSWRKLYPLGYSLDVVWGGHGEYFDEPNVADFCAKLGVRLAHAAQHPEGHALPVDALRADITAQAPAVMAPGQVLALPLRLSNLSTSTWLAGPSGGLVLANHWLASDHSPVSWLDGCSHCPRDLAPGASLDMTLLIRAPQAEGEYVLEVDLAEQGVAWSAQRAGVPWRQVIRVQGAG